MSNAKELKDLALRAEQLAECRKAMQEERERFAALVSQASKAKVNVRYGQLFFTNTERSAVPVSLAPTRSIEPHKKRKEK